MYVVLLRRPAIALETESAGHRMTVLSNHTALVPRRGSLYTEALRHNSLTNCTSPKPTGCNPWAWGVTNV
jgi:hypothetical protein